MPDIEWIMETLIALTDKVEPEHVAWRYDPVLLTPVYTIERHRVTFSRMADVLVLCVGRRIFSFVETCTRICASTCPSSRRSPWGT